jgi:Nucleotidyltransferase domain
VPPNRSARTAAAASANEALRFAERLARSCSQALGGIVAGVILHGSLTLDDYLPGRSDIDLLVVAQDPLTDPQLAALTEALASHRPQAPGPVDLRVVTRHIATSPTPAPPMEAYLRLTLVAGVRVEERRHPGARDLAVELSVCRAHGRSLLGAAPAELIGEVPERWVVAAGDAQVADWQAIGDDPPYAELTVLTACRVWRFAEQAATPPRPRPPSGRWGATPPRGGWGRPAAALSRPGRPHRPGAGRPAAGAGPSTPPAGG